MLSKAEASSENCLESFIKRNKLHWNLELFTLCFAMKL